MRLFREEEIPPGFVYVPAGGFYCGGDRDAEQGLDPEWKEVDGFFMGRREVTFDEYLKFLADPEIASRIHFETHEAEPFAD